LPDLLTGSSGFLSALFESDAQHSAEKRPVWYCVGIKLAYLHPGADADPLCITAVFDHATDTFKQHRSIPIIELIDFGYGRSRGHNDFNKEAGLSPINQLPAAGTLIV